MITSPVAGDRAEPPGPDSAPTTPRWADRLVAASTVAAWVFLALLVLGLSIGSVPVRNPRVQDCGAPLVFVLTGRVDAFVDPNSPPKGLTTEQAKAANQRPCRKRVAPRMVRSAELLLGGLVVGLAGVGMLVVGRSARRRALVRGLATAPDGAAPWEPPAAVPQSLPGVET